MVSIFLSSKSSKMKSSRKISTLPFSGECHLPPSCSLFSGVYFPRRQELFCVASASRSSASPKLFTKLSLFPDSKIHVDAMLISVLELLPNYRHFPRVFSQLSTCCSSNPMPNLSLGTVQSLNPCYVYELQLDNAARLILAQTEYNGFTRRQKKGLHTRRLNTRRHKRD